MLPRPQPQIRAICPALFKPSLVHSRRSINTCCVDPRIPLPSSNFLRRRWPHPQDLGGSSSTERCRQRPGPDRSQRAGSGRRARGAGAAPRRGCGAGGSGANPGGSPTAPETEGAQRRRRARHSLRGRQRARAAGRGSPYLLVDEAVEDADQEALPWGEQGLNWEQGQGYKHPSMSSDPLQAQTTSPVATTVLGYCSHPFPGS